MTTLDISKCTSLSAAATFKCIGPDCEDDCCHGWAVLLDQTEYNKIKDKLSHTTAGRLQFRDRVKKREKNRTPGAYADIILRDDGICPFQDQESKLCTIHRDLGESCLGQTCRTYPRKLTRVNGHFELSLALSCPEAARKILLDPDFDLIQIDLAPYVADNYSYTNYTVNGSNPLTQYVDVIRGTILQLLNETTYHINSRLFFNCFFANATMPFFSRENAKFSENKLHNEIERISNQQTLSTLNEQFISFSREENIPIDLPISFILAILLRRLGKPGIFPTLLMEIFNNYNLQDVAPQLAQTEQKNNLANIINQYKDKRSQTPRAVKEQLDHYLDRYSQYFWFSYIYTDAANLLLHTRKLFIRLALLRFLLYSHPALNEFRQLDNEARLSTPQTERIGALAVKIFYHFTRGVEHNPDLLTGIEELLDNNKMQDIEHVCILLLI